MRDLSLPSAPILDTSHFTGVEIEQPAPTHQVKPTDKDGGPLEALSTCRWCGGMHPTACPFIKIAEWHPTGQLARVVLKERVDLEKAILYPFEEDDDMLKRSLQAIVDAGDVERAREIASTLLKMVEGEKPS